MKGWAVTDRIGGEKWLDIGIGWLVRYEHSDVWLDFEAFEALAENGKNGEPDDGAKLFQRKGTRAEHEWTSNAGEAEPTITGHVKWDGCGEWSLPSLYIGGRRDVVDFAAVLVAIHDLARDTIPKFNREVGS